MHTLQRFHVPAIVAAALVAAVLVAIASLTILSQDDQAGAQDGQVPARQWPAFDMTYSEYQVDPESGAVIADRTWVLRVEDDYSWRADLVRDVVTPEEVGSYRQLRDGTYSHYSAMLQHTDTYDEGEATVAITEELSPVAYAQVLVGKGFGAGFAREASAEGTYAATRVNDGTSERIEFTTQHIAEDANGGITTSYLRLAGDKVIRRLTVDALSIH